MPSENELSLFLSGDVMSGRGIDQILPHSCAPRLYERFVTSALDYVALAERVNGTIARPVDYEYVWGDALEVLRRRRPDASIVNLETSITTSEDAAPKGINYRMHPGNAPLLTVAGIDCCVLANNHVLDWGAAGLLETVESLKRARITIAGAGPDLAAARAPAVLRGRAGARVVVFGFAAADSGVPAHWSAGVGQPGVHLLRDLSVESVDYVGRLTGMAKRPGDLAIASIHWGANWGYDIPQEHRSFAHALVDRAGIDVVHGHSSHHPRAIEVYRDRPILYGCGDLVSDYEGIRGYEEFRDDLVLMYFPAFELGTCRLVRLEMVPMRLRRFRLQRPDDADQTLVFHKMERECRRFSHAVALRRGTMKLTWNATRPTS